MYLVNNGCLIQSDKPVGVCCYLTGWQYNTSGAGSDPAQAWLPSIEQTITEALIAPFIPTGSTNLNQHYAMVITPTAAKENTLVSVGGATPAPLSGGIWRDHAAAGMSFYSMPLTNPNASYNFTNEDGIIVMGYGTGQAESYYYLGSSAMRNLGAAQNDYIQVLTCYDSTLFNVLANDNITDCTLNELEISIIHGSVAGATTTINSNKNIVYFPATGFMGRDTLEYKVICKGETFLANVFITVVECPDNMGTVDCWDVPAPTEWDIKEIGKTTQYAHPASQPLVGDVDGCGKNEIVSFNHNGTTSITNAILIFDDNLNLKSSIDISPTNCMYMTALAIADVDACGKAEIFVLTGTGLTRTLKCFWYDGTTYINKPGFIQTNTITLPASGDATFVIGDINGDGVPEILAHNTIFNAQTGSVIGTLPGGSYGCSNTWAMIYMPVFADVDNDGILEIVCGNMVYKALINDGSTALISPIAIAYQAPAGTDIKDGFTSVADIDLDGYLDVVVTHTNGSSARAYVWSPYKGTLIGVPIMVNKTYISRAFIGDVDNDGYPEIAFSYTLGMVCYKYNPNNPPATCLEQLWQHSTTDQSGYTTMTMFDFNHDGKQEIVYRDQDNLRIMDGETGLNISAISCRAGTGGEMPIVVDFTGEGFAQIIVTGSNTPIQSQIAFTQTIRLYGSSTPGAWAPTRKVWNQHAYNIVNVNEDLTIPRFPINPATSFPGPDGILGTADDIRPFNGFLMQQTKLNQTGVPFWPMTNIVWDTQPTMSITGNSAVFKGCIKNIGDAALQAPIYFTYYKNDTITVNIIALHSIQRTLAAGDTLCFTFTIHNWSAHTPVDRVWISANDKNGIYPYQQQCMVDGRRIAIDISTAFYANNVHNESLQDTTFCDNMVLFQAVIASFNAAQDSIKWYLDNIEYEPARGQLVWNKTFEPGAYTIPVEMWVRFANGEIISKSSILNVRVFWTKIMNLRH